MRGIEDKPNRGAEQPRQATESRQDLREGLSRAQEQGISWAWQAHQTRGQNPCGGNGIVKALANKGCS